MGQILRMRWPEGRLRAFTLSYDDGRKEDERLMAIMRKNGIKGTFNVNTGLFWPEEKPFPAERPDHRRFRRSEWVRFAMENRDMAEMAVHTVTHPDLTTCTPLAAVEEVAQDRAAIEKAVGAICRGMAYPYGKVSDEVVRLLEVCGIAYSRTVASSKGFQVPRDWLRLSPTCHHKSPALFDLKADFFAKEDDSRTDAQLFYLWGHTYEFDDDDNWDLIENFLAEMGGREDVWYASNIELYDYVKAYEGLIWSARGTRVKNPGAVPVWFRTYQDLRDEGRAYRVGPGEEIEL